MSYKHVMLDSISPQLSGAIFFAFQSNRIHTHIRIYRFHSMTKQERLDQLTNILSKLISG
jgi:hypothetical protein